MLTLNQDPVGSSIIVSPLHEIRKLAEKQLNVRFK